MHDFVEMVFSCKTIAFLCSLHLSSQLSILVFDLNRCLSTKVSRAKMSAAMTDDGLHWTKDNKHFNGRYFLVFIVKNMLQVVVG